MDANGVRAALMEVFQNIQTASGLECPAIIRTTKPIEELPKFDSKIWPVAIGMLGVKLGITIANDVNIFRRENTTIALRSMKPWQSWSHWLKRNHRLQPRK